MTSETLTKKDNIFKRVFSFYYEGFRSMTWGKTLWLIIFVKLFIMFAVLRVFFFPNYLNSRFDSKSEKANYVIEELTKSK